MEAAVVARGKQGGSRGVGEADCVGPAQVLSRALGYALDDVQAQPP